jgi:Tol biopolymer transport system component
MRLFLLATLSSAFVSACSPGEVIDLGGDAGQLTEKAIAPTGSTSAGGVGLNGPNPSVDASLSLDASTGSEASDPSTGADLYPDGPTGPDLFTDASLACASDDASYPSLEPGDGSAYSVPLPGTGSPASASDGWIVFDSDVNSPGNPGIYAIHPDGSGLIDIGGGTEPAVSPDGTTLAYTQTDDVGTPQVFLSLHWPDVGTGQLTSMSGGAGEAAFSPDGKTIAFHSGYDIYLMNADGTDVRRTIVSTGGAGTDEEHPTFGPGGSTLVVDRENEIDVFDLSGHYLRHVVGNYTAVETSPAISRDGATVAFLEGGCTGIPYVGLAAFGGYLPIPCNACRGSGSNLGKLGHPSWGPRTLLTMSHESANGLSRIVVLDTANLSAEPVEILQDNGNQLHPSWAPPSFQPQ